MIFFPFPCSTLFRAPLCYWLSIMLNLNWFFYICCFKRSIAIFSCILYEVRKAFLFLIYFSFNCSRSLIAIFLVWRWQKNEDTCTSIFDPFLSSFDYCSSFTNHYFLSWGFKNTYFFSFNFCMSFCRSWLFLSICVWAIVIADILLS